MYYLYSVKMGGWVSNVATYTSDLTDAGTFSEAEAMRRAKISKTPYSLGVIPVSVALMEQLS